MQVFKTICKAQIFGEIETVIFKFSELLVILRALFVNKKVKSWAAYCFWILFTALASSIWRREKNMDLFIFLVIW